MVTIPQNMVLVPDGHESMQRVIVHSNNNRHSVSYFSYKCIVASSISTYINTLSGCFLETTVTFEVELTIMYHFIMLMSLFSSWA